MDLRSYTVPIHEHPLLCLDPLAKTVECHVCQVKETMDDGYLCNEVGCGVWFHTKCAEASIDKAEYLLPIHEHPLLFLAKFIKKECRGCHVEETMYGGYLCTEAGCGAAWFHRKCVEKTPLEINHPSHPQHPLLLTNDLGDGPCVLCGKKLPTRCYSCSICEFKVDLICGKKPPLSAIEHPMCHDHPLIFLKKKEDDKEKEESPCEVCKESICGPSYPCLECNVFFHVECVNLSKEINHPSHSNHPLKFIAFDTLTDDAEKTCLLCGEETKNTLYHCFICNFTACLVCTRNPPPLEIVHTRTHKHSLTLFSKKMPFTCDVCGEEGEGAPYYVCLQCTFVIHGWCIDFPYVININRHHHCISFTHHLGVGYSKCGVCRKSLSPYHGAYSCSICPTYAVHSQCARKSDVWDFAQWGRIPDFTEDIAPFKVVGDDLISHQSHRKHNLRLQKDNMVRDKWLRCEACIHPVSFDPIYGCEECGFVLHEKCANLPMKKKLVFDTDPFTLEFDNRVLHCNLCRTSSTGFMYVRIDFRRGCDVHCGSLSEPFVHGGHLHPLYFHKNDGRYCDGCHYNVDGYVFRCDTCDFVLCFYCACLPEKIWHRNDDEHPLTLHCGEKASDNNWCDNCEREIDPCKWFYACYDCEVSLHARCVLGDFSRLRLGCFGSSGKGYFDVVSNNHSTRPLCIQCHSRCNFSIILKTRNYEDNGYICSYSCLSSIGRS